MKLDTPYKILGHVPYYELRMFVQKASTLLWDADVNRAERFAVHKDTTSIIFRFTPDLRDISKVETYDAWSMAGDALTDVLDSLSYYYKKATPIRAMAVLLPPGRSVLKHIDSPEAFGSAHRIHVPLVLYPGVEFLVEGEAVPMEEGLAIEIDNQREHEVNNKSDFPRIHLIIDLLDAYERID